MLYARTPVDYALFPPPPAPPQTISPSGALTTAGVLSKTAAKIPAGSLSTTGVLSKVGTKIPAGGLATAGGVSRATTKQLAGTLAPTGSLLKLARRILAGVLSALGSLVAHGTSTTPDLNPEHIGYRERAHIRFKEGSR